MLKAIRQKHTLPCPSSHCMFQIVKLNLDFSKRRWISFYEHCLWRIPEFNDTLLLHWKNFRLKFRIDCISLKTLLRTMVLLYRPKRGLLWRNPGVLYILQLGPYSQMLVVNRNAMGGEIGKRRYGNL